MTDRKLVVFDFDGTLIDTGASSRKEPSSLSVFSKNKGLPYDIDKFNVGYVDPLKYDLGWNVPFDQQPALMHEWEIFLSDQQVNHKSFIPELFDHIKDILQELAQKYDLSIITARDKRSLVAIMEHLGIAPYFSLYRSSCCMKQKNLRIKPAADAIHCLLSQSGHHINDTVMIGDTTSDIAMANAAGVKNIAVLWGMHPKEKLVTENPTLILEDIKALPQAIEKLFS